MNAPYSLPETDIRLDGRPLPPASLDALVEVRVQQRLSMPALCELHFVLAPKHAELQAGFAPGSRLEVGLAGPRLPIFTGEITAVEYYYGAQDQREVMVRGYDLLHRMRRRQNVRAFSQVALRDIAAQLAREAGISRVVAPSKGGRYPYLIQHQQSDLEFLVELAAGEGQYLSLRSDTLHLLELSGMEDTHAIELSYGNALLEARLEVNADRAVPGVESYAWNAATLDLPRGAARSRPSDFRGYASEQMLGSASEVVLLNQAAAGQQRAAELARAELEHRAASWTSLWGRALGSAQLFPGAMVRVGDVHKPLQGSYLITTAIHRFDTASGYVTEIDTSPPELPAPARSDTVTLGLVIDTRDPARLARVRAKLPAYNSVETDWMQVLFPGAGPGKGFITMPDAGDTVLVLLSREDPARGLVLGGLYGSRRPPDSGVEQGHVERFTWITPGNQKIQLNDAGKTIRLENGAGSYIELAGGDITIAGKAIDFKKI